MTTKQGKDYALQAIVTKYMGPTDRRGSRVIATCQAKRITISWDSSLDSFDNHMMAATELANSLGWLEKSQLVGGAMPKASGYCFVMVRKGAKL